MLVVVIPIFPGVYFWAKMLTRKKLTTNIRNWVTTFYSRFRVLEMAQKRQLVTTYNIRTLLRNVGKVIQSKNSSTILI